MILTRKLYMILQPISTMAVAVARISVAVLMLRLIGPSTWRRRFLHFSIISTFLLSSAYSVLIWTKCSPIKKIWDPLVKGRCWDGAEYAMEILASLTSSLCFFSHLPAYSYVLTIHHAGMPLWTSVLQSYPYLPSRGCR